MVGERKERETEGEGMVAQNVSAKDRETRRGKKERRRGKVEGEDENGEKMKGKI